MKERALSFLLGDGDGRYYALGAAVKPASNPYWIGYDVKVAYAKYRSLAMSNLAIPVVNGKEIFDSSTRPYGQFNDCRHWKLSGVNVPFQLVGEYYYDRYTWFEFCFARRSSFLSTYLNQVGTIPNPSWNGTEDAARRAWWSMQPRFEGEFSALNALYELKDFKDLIKHLGTAFNLTRQRDWARFTRTKVHIAKKAMASGSTAKNVLATVDASTKIMSELYLTKVFAIDPTIRDFVTLSGQLATLVDTKQKEFFDRGLGNQVSHYSETLEEASSFSTMYGNEYYIDRGLLSKVLFNATLEYRYDYQMRSYNEALKRYYGLNVNAEVVWNALPFSFVLDYVLKVSQAIANMSTDPNVSVIQNQYCESLISERTYGDHYNADGRVRHCTINGGAAYRNTLISGYRGALYLRRVCSPNKGSALPRLTLPSSKQRTNLTALLRCLW